MVFVTRDGGPYHRSSPGTEEASLPPVRGFFLSAKLRPSPISVEYCQARGHFDRLDFLLLLLLPALLRAMATACFCGLPAFISVLMFELTVLRDEPFLSGMKVSFRLRSHQPDPSRKRIRALSMRLRPLRMRPLNTEVFSLPVS